ncbi:hypothetical protein B0H12DRAFT_1140369 [Mycena haematopus]|nr:hypothetical protein B0H12DRAFT_1140369 [Mycena haematopus]
MLVWRARVITSYLSSHSNRSLGSLSSQLICLLTMFFAECTYSVLRALSSWTYRAVNSSFWRMAQPFIRRLHLGVLTAGNSDLDSWRSCSALSSDVVLQSLRKPGADSSFLRTTIISDVEVRR